MRLTSFAFALSIALASGLSALAEDKVGSTCNSSTGKFDEYGVGINPINLPLQALEKKIAAKEVETKPGPALYFLIPARAKTATSLARAGKILILPVPANIPVPEENFEAAVKANSRRKMEQDIADELATAGPVKVYNRTGRPSIYFLEREIESLHNTNVAEEIYSSVSIGSGCFNQDFTGRHTMTLVYNEPARWMDDAKAWEAKLKRAKTASAIAEAKTEYEFAINAVNKKLGAKTEKGPTRSIANSTKPRVAEQEIETRKTKKLGGVTPAIKLKGDKKSVVNKTAGNANGKDD